MGSITECLFVNRQAPGTPMIARQVTPTTIIKQTSAAQTTVQATTTLQRPPVVQVQQKLLPGLANIFTEIRLTKWLALIYFFLSAAPDRARRGLHNRFNRSSVPGAARNTTENSTGGHRGHCHGKRLHLHSHCMGYRAHSSPRLIMEQDLSAILLFWCIQVEDDLFSASALVSLQCWSCLCTPPCLFNWLYLHWTQTFKNSKV